MNESFEILKRLLKINKYNINLFDLQKRFFSDPEKGLLPITNTLTYFGIDHIAANVPKSNLPKLPSRFIAQMSNGSSDHLVLVYKLTDKTVEIHLGHKLKTTLPNSEFLKIWTGVLILVEENSVKPKGILNKVNSLKLLLGINLSLLVFYLTFSTNSLTAVLFFVITLLGLLMSFAIVSEKYGHQTALSKFCKISHETSCQVVLNSRSARIFNGLDLTDLTILYFLYISTSFIILPFSKFFLISSTLSIPVVLYSIYQQKYVLKKWCPLCLAISTTLLVQFFLQVTNRETLGFDIEQLVILVIVFGIVVLTWNFLISFMSRKKQNQILEIENLRFRRDHNLFLPFFKSLPLIDTEKLSIPFISIGSKKPIVDVLVITNPMCQSCIESHQTYMDILNEYYDSARLSFIFLVPYNKRNDLKTTISERLLQLFCEFEKDTFLAAFNDCYKDTHGKKWIERWGVADNSKYNGILEKQIRWCYSQNINTAPTVLINNRMFPKMYHQSDILNFIEPILESLNYERQNIHA